MSIELRCITTVGPCECGIPHKIGYEVRCVHEIECDWGTFGDPPLIVADYQAGTITVENASPLILVSKAFVDRGGTVPGIRESEITSVYERDGRRFMMFTASNGTWTWELFDAHWAGREASDGLASVYIARWPD